MSKSIFLLVFVSVILISCSSNMENKPEIFEPSSEVTIVTVGEEELSFELKTWGISNNHHCVKIKSKDSDSYCLEYFGQLPLIVKIEFDRGVLYVASEKSLKNEGKCNIPLEVIQINMMEYIELKNSSDSSLVKIDY